MTKLSTSYNNSHAIIIGIDEYRNASPLGYAVADATAIAEILVSNFGFPPNIANSLCFIG